MKKTRLYSLLVLTLSIIVAISLGAVTLTNDNVYPKGFLVSATSADWTDAEIIKAAVTGKSIYVESAYISSGVSTFFTLGAGDANSGVTTELLGPIFTNAGNVSLDFKRPIVVSSATDLVLDANNSGNATIIVQGFIK